MMKIRAYIEQSSRGVHDLWHIVAYKKILQTCFSAVFEGEYDDGHDSCEHKHTTIQDQ